MYEADFLIPGDTKIKVVFSKFLKHIKWNQYVFQYCYVL